MLEMGTSGLMSGMGNGGAARQYRAILDLPARSFSFALAALTRCNERCTTACSLHWRERHFVFDGPAVHLRWSPIPA